MLAEHFLKAAAECTVHICIQADKRHMPVNMHLDVFTQVCNCCLDVLCDAVARVFDERLLKQRFL